MATENSGRSDYYHSSLETIDKLLTRVDERVQMMMKTQSNLEAKIDNIHDDVVGLNARMRSLESAADEDTVEKLQASHHQMELRMQTVENSSNSQEGRWKTIFGFGIQLVWVILAAFLLYKLGISAPAVP
jgi:predicted nuclease with TOPRIM domain